MTGAPSRGRSTRAVNRDQQLQRCSVLEVTGHLAARCPALLSHHRRRSCRLVPVRRARTLSEPSSFTAHSHVTWVPSALLAARCPLELVVS